MIRAMWNGNRWTIARLRSQSMSWCRTFLRSVTEGPGGGRDGAHVTSGEDGRGHDWGVNDPGFLADDEVDAPRRGRPAWVIATGIVLAVALAAVFVVPAASTWFAVNVGDNRPSGVACAGLPTRAEVENALALHSDLVRRIEAVGADDDSVWVDVVQRCQDHPDRAEILIAYPGGGARERIEAILAEESFGVPVSLLNY